MKALRPFDHGFGERPTLMSERITYFDHSQSVITLHPWTVTLVTITAPVGFLGDRAAIIPASMAAATDGAHYCIGTAAIRPQANKPIEFILTMRATAFADPKFMFGFATVSTTGTANLIGGTNYVDELVCYKTTGTTNLVLQARKASGTLESQSVSFAGGDATWLRFHLICTRSDTAGLGKMDLYGGADSLVRVPQLASWTVPTQFADTVSLAPQFGWLSGANNTGLSHHMAGWRVSN